MKRTKEHVIEETSLQIFSRSIPKEWINRPLVPDYALDRSIEIVENGNLTGAILHAQLKGIEHPKIIDDHNVTYSLEAKYLQYYIQKDVPVILVIVDVLKEQCYWVFLQRYVYEILDIDKPSWTTQKTITIHVPLKNEVPKTISRLIEIAKGGPTYLITKKIDRIPNEYLGYWQVNADAIEGLLAVAEKLSKKRFHIKFDVSYRFAKEGDRDNAYKVLFDVYKTALAAGDKDSCIKSAFAMTFYMNPYYENSKIVELLNSIREITEESGNIIYDVLWRGIFLETVFAGLLRNYNHILTLHLVASQAPTQGIMAPFLVLEAQKVISKISEVMTEMATCIRTAFEEEEPMVYVDLLQRIAKMQYLWCYNNSLGGNARVTYNNLRDIRSMLVFTKNLASKFSKDFEYSLLLDLARLYGALEEGKLCDKALHEAMNLAKEIDHKGYQQEVEHVREYIKKMRTIPFLLKQGMRKSSEDMVSITDEQEEEMIKHLLRIGGFYEDDRLAELAEIGLKDRNPERILRYCEYLYTEILIYGPIWDMVALPSTGTKILYCEKKEEAIIGRELDQILDRMKKENCINCKFRSPRPNEWKWTHEWQREREQPQKVKEILENYFKV